DKEIKSITLSYNTNENYGLNILAENDVLAVDSETSVLFRYSENEELGKWFIKVITADDVETELEGVEITEDIKEADNSLNTIRKHRYAFEYNGKQ
ncbi:MAG: hypothetical protein GYA02_03380, partial [Clostridiaceae bacterium]|nr:hypothetical protein [Clostridiaceae bacterium]